MPRSRFSIALLIIVVVTLVFAAVLVQDASGRPADPTRIVDMLCGGPHSGLAIYTGASTHAALALQVPTALRHPTGPCRPADAVDARPPRFRGLRQASPSVTSSPLRI